MNKIQVAEMFLVFFIKSIFQHVGYDGYLCVLCFYLDISTVVDGLLFCAVTSL